MQRPDGSFPRNGLLNGKAAPDTGGLQLDETADPILMAWQAGLAGDAALYTEHIRPAADFLAANGPVDGVERWEEQTGFSPSTMADEVAAWWRRPRSPGSRATPRHSSCSWPPRTTSGRLILATTVTSNGPLSSQPTSSGSDKTGDPDQAFSYTLGNGDPTSYDQRAVVDQGFVELTRLGELPASDPLVKNSLAVTGAAIGAEHRPGPGSCATTATATATARSQCSMTARSTASPGPPATRAPGTRGPCYPARTARTRSWPGPSAVTADLAFMLNSASGVGLVPEQVWNYPDVPASPYGADPATASIGFVNGQPDGSAAPLTWAQAQLLRLISDRRAGSCWSSPRSWPSATRARRPPATTARWR